MGLIATADVPFSDGLTAFTGETGSGKTMLLGALQLALGGRAAPDLVARDRDKARVTLHIEPDDALRRRFAEDGFELEPDEDAIFEREVQREGKSAARINGRAATAAHLRAYAEALVDFVGQHEQQRLLSSAYQTELLDRFAGDEATELLRRVGVAHARLRTLDAELDALQDRAGHALAEAEFARFAAAEIGDAQLSDGEEDELRRRRSYLANAERITQSLAAARLALIEGEAAAGEGLGRAASALQGIASFGEPLSALADRAGALQSDLTDLAVAVAREEEHAEYNPAETEHIGERLDLIERLKKKYGASIRDVLSARERFVREAAAYEDRDARSEALVAERRSVDVALRGDAESLSALRASAARRLEARVAAELGVLGMPHARFAVLLEAYGEIGPHGRERAAFALAANRGEDPRPIVRVASGGELSRVLLALVVVLSDGNDGSTLVFDEIDAGIGGATAASVGQRLGTLARAAQVLCVTHLPQIASWADVHVALRKRETRSATRIDAIVLQPDAIREELARMLSGSTARVALEHADALLRETRGKGPKKLRSA